MVRAFKATVSGRVQGVLFRDFARRTARDLNLVGEARNMADGTVRVYAEGSKTHLHEFIRALEKGPVMAEVDRVSCTWVDPLGRFRSFLIA